VSTTRKISITKISSFFALERQENERALSNRAALSFFSDTKTVGKRREKLYSHSMNTEYRPSLFQQDGRKKTLILNGSPRLQGETGKMTHLLKSALTGDVVEIRAYDYQGIGPCTDCRFCWTHDHCSIHDDMQILYQALDEANQIVFATPVYFAGLPSPFKTIIDRLQLYFASNVIRKKPRGPKRPAALLLCGGAPHTPEQFLGCELTFHDVFRCLGLEKQGEITFSSTDTKTLKDEKERQSQIQSLSSILNK